MPVKMVSNAAIRQRKHRERERAGMICLTVVVDEIRLVAVLQDARLVSDDPSREELAAVVARWIANEVTRYEQERWPVV